MESGEPGIPMVMELVKARLTLLVLFTTFTGFCMASKGGWDFWLMFHVMAGTALVASGAAVLNQYLERELDARMHRTRARPLPTGRISPEDAMLLGSILSVLGLLYLACCVNLLTSFLGVVTLLGYLFVYTPLKTMTPLCTLVGAIPGALPPMMGWTAVSGRVDPGAWMLFSILFLWQMPHFFALAQMYREDYKRGGFAMLTVVDLDGARTGLQIITHSALLIPASLAPYFFGLTGHVYPWVAGFLSGIFCLVGVVSAIQRTDQWSRRLFLISIIHLPLLLIAMLLDRV